MMTTSPTTVTGTVGNLTSIEAALAELRKIPSDGFVGAAMSGMTVTLIVHAGGGGAGSAVPSAPSKTRPANGVAPSAGQAALAQRVRAWVRANGERGVSVKKLREQFSLSATAALEIGEILIAEGFFGKGVRHVGFPVLDGAGSSGSGSGRSSARPGAARRVPGQKRAPEQIAATTEALRVGIQNNPGSNISALKRLPGLEGCTTEDLAIPLARLFEEGTIHSMGERRGTKYFPGKAAKARAATNTSPKKTKAAGSKKTKAKGAKGAKAKGAKVKSPKVGKAPKKGGNKKKNAPAGKSEPTEAAPGE